MATPATGVKSVIYGDMKTYKVRKVLGFTLRRLDEKYIEDGQIGFIAFMRADGDLLDPGSRAMKHLIQA